jgi:hypothetical protein
MLSDSETSSSLCYRPFPLQKILHCVQNDNFILFCHVERWRNIFFALLSPISVAEDSSLRSE